MSEGGPTLSRSTNSAHAFRVHRLQEARDPLISPLAAFITHFFSSCLPSSSSSCVDEVLDVLCSFGISCTADRNSGASSRGTEKTNVGSCDIEENGPKVEG